MSAIRAGGARRVAPRAGAYRAVIFDWDGTLLDSVHPIVAALQAACGDLGLPRPSPQQAAQVIGLSVQSALYRLVPGLTARNAEVFVERYRWHFERTRDDMQLFPGQEGLLGELHARGVVLGIATGKSRRGLDAALARMGLGALFQATRCADEARGKPAPDMLEQLMGELDLPPRDLLMVGDTTHDIHMAQAAGVDSLAVGYGAHAPADLQSAGPTALALTVPQMQDWVRTHT